MRGVCYTHVPNHFSTTTTPYSDLYQKHELTKVWELILEKRDLFDCWQYVQPARLTYQKHFSDFSFLFFSLRYANE